MNDFKLYRNFAKGSVYFKVWINNKESTPKLCLTVSYHSEGEFPGEIRLTGVPHKDFAIYRDSWMMRVGHDEISKVLNDFNESVREFESNLRPTEYINPVSKYLLLEVDSFLEGIAKNL